MWDVKYRPLQFADVLGQEGTCAVLKSRLKRGTANSVVASAIVIQGGLFRGPAVNSGLDGGKIFQVLGN